MPNPDFSLGQHLLLAAPTITGGDFGRGVVLLTRHNKKDGAIGLLMNKPLGKKVQELVSDPELAALADVPVLIGGPVARQQLSLVSVLWDPEKNHLSCQSDISASRALELRAEGWKILAFAGYSGWSPGQLEGELTANAWFVRPPSPTMLSPLPSDLMWKELLREMGPIFELISESPEAPYLN